MASREARGALPPASLLDSKHALPRGGGPQEREGPRPVTLVEEQQAARIQAIARGVATRAAADKKFGPSDQEALQGARQHVEAQRRLFKEVHEILGVSREVYTSSPHLQKAHAYMQEHQLPRLLEGLLAQVALERPDDLRGFLIHSIQEMIEGAGRTNMGVFSEEDIETMFDMWDELKTGSIPVEKVRETLESLGCAQNADEAITDYAGSSDMVEKGVFMAIIRSELETHNTLPETMQLTAESAENMAMQAAAATQHAHLVRMGTGTE